MESDQGTSTGATPQDELLNEDPKPKEDEGRTQGAEDETGPHEGGADAPDDASREGA